MEEKDLDYTQKIRDAADKEDYTLAIKICEQILQADPNNISVNLELLSVYFTMNNYTLVSNVGQKILKLNSNKIQKSCVYYAKSLLLLENKEFKKALSEATKCVKLCEDSATLKLRARIYLELGSIEMVISDLNKAIELDPKNYELYEFRKKQFLGYTIFLKKEKYGPKPNPNGHGFIQPLSTLNEAIKDEPNNPVPYLLRAEKMRSRLGIPEFYYIYFGSDKEVLLAHEQMMSDYDMALHIEPKNPIVLVERSIERKNNSIDELKASLKDNKKAKRLSPENSWNFVTAKENVKYFKKELKKKQKELRGKTDVFFDDLKEKVIEFINSAKFDVKIAVAWITDTDLIRALTKRQKAGIQITIVYYDDKVNDSKKFDSLFQAGAIIKSSKKLMHNKFCVIDNRIVLNGSFNWTDNADRNNMENIQVTYDPELSLKFSAQFDVLINESKDALKSYSDIKIEIQEHYDQYYNFARVFNDADWTPCLQHVEKSARKSYHQSHFIVLAKSLYLVGPKYKFEVINSGYYVLQNKEQANEFIYQMYFLNKEYDLNTVQEVTGRKFNLPLRIVGIEGLESDNEETYLDLTLKSYTGTALIPNPEKSSYDKRKCIISKDAIEFIE